MPRLHLEPTSCESFIMPADPSTNDQSLSRATRVRAAAAALCVASPHIASLQTLVGFDGFVDSITRLVRLRTSMAPDAYEPLATIAEFGERVSAASGLSTNIERVTLEDRFGGNGPLFAGALARLGAPVTFIGAVASLDDPSSVHSAFSAFASRCQRIIPIASPSHTLCLEFDDGKVMLNDTRQVQHVTWKRILEVVGLESFRELFAASSLVSIVNWSLLGGVPAIWQGLLRDVLPFVSSTSYVNQSRPRILFVDLSDPAKRIDADIREMLTLLRELQTAGLRVILGLNHSEATRIATVAGVATPDAIGHGLESVMRCAIDLQRALNVYEVVIHPREGAASANAQGEHDWIDGPMVRMPKLSTGAGDHFNAGYCFARALNLNLSHALAIGVATSGAYVRDAESPSFERLCEFVATLPAAEA